MRRRGDGGRFQDTEAQRVSLLLRLVEGGFSHVDLEEDLEAPELDAAARRAGARIVRSFHDFSGVPAGFPDGWRPLRGERMRSPRRP